MKPQSKYFGNPAEDGMRDAREEACMRKAGKKTVDLRNFKPLQDEVLKLIAQNKELIEAIEQHRIFIDILGKEFPAKRYSLLKQIDRLLKQAKQK